MKALSKPMKEELWNIWSQTKKPGYTPRTYAVGARKRTIWALSSRGLLRWVSPSASPREAYTITAAGKKLAVELFG